MQANIERRKSKLADFTLLCCASILFWPPPTSAAFRLLSILSLTDRWLIEYHRQSRWRFLGGIAATTAPCFTCAKLLKDILNPFISPQLLRATLRAAIIAVRVLCWQPTGNEGQRFEPIATGGRALTANQKEGMRSKGEWAGLRLDQVFL